MPSIFRTEDTCPRGCLTLAGLAGLVIWVYGMIWGAGFVGGLVLGLVCAILGGASLRWLICDGRQVQPGAQAPAPLPLAVTRGAGWGQHVRNVFTDDSAPAVGVAARMDAPPEAGAAPVPRAERVVTPAAVAAAAAGTPEPVAIAAPPPAEEPEPAHESAPMRQAAPAPKSAPKPAAVAEDESTLAPSPEPAVVSDPTSPRFAAGNDAAPVKDRKAKAEKDRSGKDKPRKAKKEKKADKAARKEKARADRPGAIQSGVVQPSADQPVATITAPQAPARTSGKGGGKKFDDLKEIKGIGPKYEKMLNDLGYRRFKHIAAWTEADIARMQEVMPNFDNRIRSEDWIGQAAVLAGRSGSGRK